MVDFWGAFTGSWLGAVSALLLVIWMGRKQPPPPTEWELEWPEPEPEEEDPADYWKHGARDEGDYS